ncbi:MAG: helix-turn-helix transcriptional regulator [Pseudonocardiales bacterium]|nr:helix-turn-helix transcriptional regulator [Pseudonocardiales bacterium]MBV9031224.1 helix-turn-helix transcriptional regulator [Pseudonocardiales bacterium]
MSGGEETCASAEGALAVGVGARVAEERKVSGLTQRQLAERAYVSLSLLRKVEQGSVPASPAFTSAVARGLGMGVAELLGQPYPRETAADHRVFAAVPALRRELTADSLAPGEGVRPRPTPQLAEAVATASQLRHAVDLQHLGAELPGLLEELRAAWHHTAGSERERVFGLLAGSYYAAGQLAWKLGYTDLASISVDRYEWAAERSGDELAVLVGVGCPEVLGPRPDRVVSERRHRKCLGSIGSSVSSFGTKPFDW